MKSVADVKAKAERDKKQLERIYNPDDDDFTVKYGGKSYTIFSREIDSFPVFIAEHIKKHLATHLLNKRGIKTNSNDDLDKIKEEISIVL